MRQSGGTTRRVANGKIVVVDYLCPEIDRLSSALFDAGASCSGRLVEGLNAGVSLVGWARGPFPVSGERRNSGHTYTDHSVAPFDMANEAMRWISSSWDVAT